MTTSSGLHAILTECFSPPDRRCGPPAMRDRGEFPDDGSGWSHRNDVGMDQRPTEPSIELDTSVSFVEEHQPRHGAPVRLDPTPPEVGQGEQQHVTALAGPGQDLTVNTALTFVALSSSGYARELLGGADVPQQPDACEFPARGESAVGRQRDRGHLLRETRQAGDLGPVARSKTPTVPSAAPLIRRAPSAPPRYGSPTGRLGTLRALMEASPADDLIVAARSTTPVREL